MRDEKIMATKTKSTKLKLYEQLKNLKGILGNKMSFRKQMNLLISNISF